MWEASNLADDGHDLAEDDRVIARDRIERRVVRHEPHLALGALEGLDRGFAVDHRRDDVAVVGHVLLAYDDPVPVADRRVDHGFADHLQQKQRALAHEFAGEWEDVFDGFLGEDRAAGGDPAEHRYESRFGQGVRTRYIGGDCGTGRVVRASDIHGARAVRIAAQIALLLQRAQLVGHR
ncbi:hypothetical protein MAUB1S_00471 [Mycolicibacterium aubagnense]